MILLPIGESFMSGLIHDQRSFEEQDLSYERLCDYSGGQCLRRRPKGDQAAVEQKNPIEMFCRDV